MVKNFYQKLDWDSKLFGYKVSRLLLSSNTKDLDKYLEKLKKNRFKLISWSVDPSNNSGNKTAIKNNGKLIDIKITYTIKLPKGKVFKFDDHTHSYLKHLINDQLLSLSFQSGAYSRFKLDNNFAQNEFEKIYSNWIKNSLSGKIAKEVLVYKDNIEIGLLTLGKKNNRCEIGLLAVDNKYRGKSIGSKLVNSSFAKALELGYEEIQVVTQKSNIGACRFYEKLGFKIEKIENIYHFWLL